MKIAVCIPVHGDTKARFTLSAMGLTARTMAAISPEMQFFLSTGSTLPELRNQLAKEALSTGADWLLWLDADHTFPDDALLRLLRHDLAVVGANYARRNPQDAPVAVRHERLVHTTAEKAKAKQLVEVDSIGLGLCLMRADIFVGLEQPFFAFEAKPGQPGFVGEDFVFFRKLRERGIKIHVDHDLSWEVGHVSETVLKNADTGRGYVSTILPSTGAQ